MNISILNDYRDRGLLMNQFHPYLPLIIWNYTQKVQYEGLWDEITINCRALVTDFDGKIISKGFSKFWNIEENRHGATDDFEVLEKLDGQYIGVFWYNDRLVVNSKGSFTSKFAIEAQVILEEKYPKFVDNFKILKDENLTICMELIGFEQIVVSYPESNLIVTGVFQNGINLGLNYGNVLFGHIPIVQSYSGLDYTQIKQLNWENQEGFVVRFSNGQRCKIKFEDYITLHWQMTDNTTGQIWRALMEGNAISEVLNDVPDEFFEKIHSIEREFKNKFTDIEEMSKLYFQYFKPLLNAGRRTFVEKVNLLLAEPYCSIVKAMIDDKNYDQMIWKRLKPSQSTKI